MIYDKKNIDMQTEGLFLKGSKDIVTHNVGTLKLNKDT